MRRQGSFLKAVDAATVSKTTVYRAFSDAVEPTIGTILSDSGDNLAPTRRSASPIKVNYDPVQIYLVQEASILNDHILFDDKNVYFDTSLAAFNGNHETQLRRRAALVETVESAQPSVSDIYRHDRIFVAHNEGGGTWGHYLLQNFPKILLARRLFPDAKIALPPHYMDQGNPWGELLALAGIKRQDFAPVEKGKLYRIGEAIVCDFLWNFEAGFPHPEAIDLILGATAPASPALDGGIYVVREPKYGRSISNDARLIELCSERKFRPFYSSSMTVEAQIAGFQGSKSIVGVLGSDLTNIVYAKPGTKILSLSPAWHGDRFFFNVAAQRKLVWNELICTRKTESHDIAHKASFEVDEDKFVDILEKAFFA